MTKFTLPIGTAERHNIDVVASLLKGVQVQVDGKPISTFNSLGRSKMVKFSVGEKEAHEVEVRVRGYVLHRIDILVDGKFSGQG